MWGNAGWAKQPPRGSNCPPADCSKLGDAGTQKGPRASMQRGPQRATRIQPAPASTPTLAFKSRHAARDCGTPWEDPTRKQLPDPKASESVSIPTFGVPILTLPEGKDGPGHHPPALHYTGSPLGFPILTILGQTMPQRALENLNGKERKPPMTSQG